MKKTIILARYNEDIKWIEQEIRLFDTIFIANKGKDLEKINNNKVIHYKLKNVGREAHTYLNFICNFYDYIESNSDDLFIFSQAWPFDANPEFIEDVKNIGDSTVFPLSLSKAFRYEKKNADPEIYPRGHPNGIPFLNYYNHLFFDESFGTKGGHEHLVKYNAMWAVPAENILFRKKEFYKKCLKTLDNRLNPFESYLFERMWQYIFDKQILDWTSHYEEIRSKYACGIYRNLKIE